MKYLFNGGVPYWKIRLFEEHNRPLWKIYVCLTKKCQMWTLLENYKKVAPGKK